jgi:hypothetical protein
MIDRRFNRRRYDTAHTIERFSDRLHQQVDLEHLTAELLAVVEETMQPTLASMWLRPTPNSPSHAGLAGERHSPAMTPCMPCSFGLLHRPRSKPCAQPIRLLEVTVVVRWIPLMTAAYGTRMARPATTMLAPGHQGRLPGLGPANWPAYR